MENKYSMRIKYIKIFSKKEKKSFYSGRIGSLEKLREEQKKRRGIYNYFLCKL
tara:strand:- start:1266 stop:1424 length:159 start_codon:yes stop_codon:yes gene_type:complete